MGFKADTSFLRFLTMGAAAVRRTMAQLTERGFRPIELERYCGSNKIWGTKVKRLRLPDLLCVRTGLRLEVRAKSNLELKMSDAPSNPDRAWDAGLRDDDVIAFVASFDTPEGYIPADSAVFFSVHSLRDALSMSKVGPPKSASEGAERDRSWPAVVPKRDGKVLSVSTEKLVVLMDADVERPERKQTYALNGKTPYVDRGDRFRASVDILAGAPCRMANLNTYLHNDYKPLNDARSPNDLDRYAAVKALRHRDDNFDRARAALEDAISTESEQRVKLEAAGSAAFLGSKLGEEAIGDFVWNDDTRSDLRMEAILVLTELTGSPFSQKTLKAVASAERFKTNEIRQAAIWGLGKSGMKAYAELLPFIDDTEENVALHAIAAFGADTPSNVVGQLVRDLIDRDRRRAPAASEVLRTIDSEAVYAALIEAARSHPTEWVVATLGRLSAEKVQDMLAGDPLLERVAPMLLLTERGNWLARESIRTDIAFLLKQNL